MKWITRARPKTDRIACRRLVAKFTDPAAEFLYVPTFVYDVLNASCQRQMPAAA